MRRTATADTEGRFRFARLKPGAYLVRSVVTWKEEADSGLQGGVIAALVTVEEAADNELILSRRFTQDSAVVLGIVVASDSQLAKRPHRVIGRVTGNTCETENEALAREDLVYRAGKRGADAVARISCRKRGITLTAGCISRIECEGDAIAWS
ncbi:MAG TPA: hypothetical protein VI383_05355 [Gemmatimonadales bacterium]|nr:hypothetical protein [Gemmatimonadales bacterium]